MVLKTFHKGDEFLDLIKEEGIGYFVQYIIGGSTQECVHYELNEYHAAKTHFDSILNRY